MEIEFITPVEIADSFTAPKLVVHETCDSIFYEHWNFEKDLTFEELLDSEMGAEDAEGNEIEGAFTMRDMLEQTKQNGFWAYSGTKENELHIWVGTLAESFESLLMILGHELGHLLENSEHKADSHCEHDENEHSADRYGIATVWAYRFANQLLNKK